jgi:hypothetical protein
MLQPTALEQREEENHEKDKQWLEPDTKGRRCRSSVLSLNITQMFSEYFRSTEYQKTSA